MCIPMPYLLPTFVYKNKIYYHNNEDDYGFNDEDNSNYCINIVYVADLYWLFTTVEQKSYSETYSLCIVSIHIVLVKQNKKKNLHTKCKVECHCEMIHELMDVICKVMRVKGKRERKLKQKNLETVIHCCKCNGQNVSRVSIVKPCVLFSVFL